MGCSAAEPGLPGNEPSDSARPDYPRSDGATIADSFERPEQFGAIFDRHYTAVNRYLARRTARAQADDLASATFVIAFERRRAFRPQSTSARPWLYGIATNLLRESGRAARREGEVALRLSAELSASAGHDGVPGLSTERLSAALAALEAGQRDVLLLYAWEELSYEEIAEALEIPLGTVRSRLSRARSYLRGELAQRSPTSDRPQPIDTGSTR